MVAEGISIIGLIEAFEKQVELLLKLVNLLQ
jgi:hypothetical protein